MGAGGGEEGEARCGLWGGFREGGKLVCAVGVVVCGGQLVGKGEEGTYLPPQHSNP